jgi:hypothetical protein
MVSSVAVRLRIPSRWIVALALFALTGAALAADEAEDTALVGEADVV